MIILKKFVIGVALLISILIQSSLALAYPDPYTNTYKEGIYHIDAKDFADYVTFNAELVTPDFPTYIMIFNENYTHVLTKRFDSRDNGKLKLGPLKGGYTIVILGEGEIYLSPSTS